MRIFGAVKDTYKKSEAAAVVQELLKAASVQELFGIDPVKTATALVSRVWDMQPEIMSGALGGRPHRFSIAAVALAKAIKVEDAIDNMSPSAAFAFCLSQILKEVREPRTAGQLSLADMPLIGYAEEIFERFATASREEPLDRELASMIGPSWDEWYNTFKTEAGRINPVLNLPENGASLFDLLLQAPLRAAFEQGIDPKVHAASEATLFTAEDVIKVLSKRAMGVQ